MIIYPQPILAVSLLGCSSSTARNPLVPLVLRMADRFQVQVLTVDRTYENDGQFVLNWLYFLDGHLTTMSKTWTIITLVFARHFNICNYYTVTHNNPIVLQYQQNINCTYPAESIPKHSYSDLGEMFITFACSHLKSPSSPVSSLALMHSTFVMTDKCMMTEDAQQHQSGGDASWLALWCIYLREYPRSLEKNPTLLWTRTRLECCHLLWRLLTDFLADCCSESQLSWLSRLSSSF